MLPVPDALEIVLQHSRCLAAVEATAPAGVLGRILAEDVASDIDSPPFDKALMDGYAVRAADLTAGEATLPVAAEVTAGRSPPPLPLGQAIRIMTGAPIPAGADAVIRVEQTRLLPDGRVRLESPLPPPGHNILPQGREMRRGDVILNAGIRLEPQEIGVLASVGRTRVKVIPKPTLAIVATGDELVEPHLMPGPGQLRNSNASMLFAQAFRAGATPQNLGIGADNIAALSTLIESGLRADILVLSGGVSMGKLDLVPQVLKNLQVQPHFHQIAMKPGKPLLFGTCGSTLVFGLPGNPVSSFCCFELFVRSAIRKLAGRAEPSVRWLEATLAQPYHYSTDRPTYHPARVDDGDARRSLRLLPWFGSADLRALCGANALVLLPAGAHDYAAGQSLQILLLD